MNMAKYHLVIIAAILFHEEVVRCFNHSNHYGRYKGEKLLDIDEKPQQVHLAYGESPDVMVVTWATMKKPSAISQVQYGLQSNVLSLVQNGSVTQFVDGSEAHRKIYMHRVKLRQLKPGTIYYYRCGSSDGGFSNIFKFMAMKLGSTWSPRFVLYGDLGLEEPQSLKRLINDTNKDMYDLVLHIGDIAYNMDTNESNVGDAFMRMIEPIAARIPYMTCVGNHEGAFNFSNYKARFSMPGAEQNMMYSFNVGPAHIIALSTEFYFFLFYAPFAVFKQLRFLEDDLNEANKPENRAIRPWIITMGHRPMYCTNDDKDDCTKNESVVRTGLPYFHVLGLENILYKYGVDLELWAHEHSYERLWPVYNRKVYNGSYSAPYTNPRAPVHIITGAGGNHEGRTPFLNTTTDWAAFRSTDFGYTRMQIFNATHLYLEQVSDDQGGKVIDKMWLIKDKHGPYKPA